MLFITGNKNKLKEASAILGVPLESYDIDLVEIQSMSVEEVVQAKVLEAKKHVSLGTPFFVEDTGLYIDDANGFPGALIKLC